MSAQNGGGSAFPVVGMNSRHGQQFIGVFDGGMTLRDYFAAKADIPWEVAADVVYRQNGNANGTLTQIMRKRSQLRFEQADEMLAERAQ